MVVQEEMRLFTYFVITIANGENFYAHALQPFMGESQISGNGVGHINESAGNEGAAVGHAGLYAFTVGQRGDTHHAGEGQGAVGCIVFTAAQGLTNGIDTAAAAVKGCNALCLIAECRVNIHGHKAVTFDGVGGLFIALIGVTLALARGKYAGKSQHSNGETAELHAHHYTR